MEKALEILKQVKELSGWIKCGAELPCDEELDEAIAELEEAQLTRREWYQKGYNEAMKHKTCGECAAYDKDGNCKEGVRISNVQGVPSSFYCKWHEPKDNA